MEEPIVILGMPRSGTSLTAGIFHKHGVWAGRCMPGDNANPRGHFENLDIKAEMIRRHGRLAQTTRRAEFREGWRAFIEKVVPEKGRWLMKHSAMYWPMWGEFSPKYVCVRRQTDGVLGSNLKTGFLGTRDEGEMRKIISAHHREMDLSKGVNVYTDELIEGNFSSVIKALEHCGLDPDLKVIADFVEPSFWGRWSR